MNKRTAGFLILMALALSASAQGVINFNNSVLTPPPDRLVRTWEAGPLVGTEWGVQLYYSTTDAGSLQAHTAAPQRFRPPTTTSPGTWSTTGGNRTLNGGGVGQTVWVQVRVWNLDQFPTYEAALAGRGAAGYSSAFQYVQRQSPQPDPTDTYMLNFIGFTFSIVPEPGVGLLVMPAMAVLILLRKRTARG